MGGKQSKRTATSLELPFLPGTLDESTLALAEELLTSLSGALFATAPDREQLTWPDRDESPTLAQRANEDLTARLERAEMRFRTLVEQIPAITFMAFLGEGDNEVYVSPHIEQVLGYTQEEWLSDPFLWYYRLHPDDRALWNDEFARGCRCGGPFRAECRFLARNGDIVWILGEARLVKDGLGRPQFLQGIAFDITQSKKAQELILETAVRTARMQEELEIAKRVQTSLLPANTALPGLAIASVMLPAVEIGGDYFDVLPNPDGGWLAIGDVSGRGMNAGLVMLTVKSAVAGIIAARSHATPREALTLLNETLCDNILNRLGQNDYGKLCLLKYQRNGQVSFAGAHQVIIVWRKATGNIERVVTSGGRLDIQRQVGTATPDSMLKLEDGDLIVLCTDGILEARNGAGEGYEIGRLCEAIRSKSEESVEEIRDHLIRSVQRWALKQEDDMTLLVMRYHSSPTLA